MSDIAYKIYTDFLASDDRSSFAFLKEYSTEPDDLLFNRILRKTALMQLTDEEITRVRDSVAITKHVIVAGVDYGRVIIEKA